MFNHMRLIGTAGCLSLFMLMAGTGTSNAATCRYIAQDSAGQYAHADGYATALKMSTACDRARHECNRRLERAFKRGEAGRGAQCYKRI